MANTQVVVAAAVVVVAAVAVAAVAAAAVAVAVADVMATEATVARPVVGHYRFALLLGHPLR